MTFNIGDFIVCQLPKTQLICTKYVSLETMAHYREPFLPLPLSVNNISHCRSLRIWSSLRDLLNTIALE